MIHRHVNRYRGVIRTAVLVLIVAVLTATDLYAGVLTGVVIDAESGSPVARAVIEIAGQERAEISNQDGEFSFHSLEQGTYELRCHRIGYEENQLKLECTKSETTGYVIYLFPRALESSPQVVTGNWLESRFAELNEMTGVVEGRELQQKLNQTLAATLKNETGLAIRSMGPAPARPVIRGLGGDRVMIAEDGSKTSDLSATSPDHAVTIEPFSLQRLEVMRGPKVLLLSSTTIGGVVNVIRNEIPIQKHDNIQGVLGTYGETVNDGQLMSASGSVPLGDFVAKGEFNRRTASDMDTPEGELDNSYSDDQDWSAGGAYFFERGLIGYSYRDFELGYGIPGGFIGGHPKGVDIEMKKRRHSVRIKYDLNSGFFERLKLSIKRTYYRHTEYESNGSVGADFKITNRRGYAHLDHSEKGSLKRGTWGVSIEDRDYRIGGHVFNPDSRSMKLAVFAYEYLQLRKLGMEFGVRYEYNKIEPRGPDLQSGIGEIRKRIFNSLSLSAAFLYDLSLSFHFGLNISRSARVPTIEELYSEGPHLAAYSFEVGNPDLKGEHGWGAEIYSYYYREPWYFRLTYYRNELDNYVIARNSGEINYATFLPIYASDEVGAVLQGIEAETRLKTDFGLKVSATLSYTRGTLSADDSNLPQIPPLKGDLSAQYSHRGFTLGADLHLADRQDKVDQFEEPTAGYVVFDLRGQYLFNLGGQIHSFNVMLDNLLDTEYRNHLSRIKSILPEAGRSLRLTYKLYFDL